MEGAPQASFSGWAIVEIMGHNREIGFVTTEYYGAAALFRVDTPALPERDCELKRPEYVRDASGARMWADAGSKVKRVAVPPKSALVGPASIFRITPCTEQTAMEAIESLIERPLILLELAKNERPALTAHTEEQDDLAEQSEDSEQDEIPY